MLNVIAMIVGGMILIGLIMTCLPYAVGLAIIGGAIYLTYSYWKIAVPIWVGFIILGAYFYHEEKKKVKLWKEKKSEKKIYWEVDNIISSSVYGEIVDRNEDSKYIFSNIGENKIPFGRVNAFLNFFDSSINETDPLYYSVLKSKEKQEIREYGTLISRDGIYISHQLDDKNSDGVYKVENICIPFSGISKVEKNKDKLKISIIKEDNELETVINVSDKNTTISLESIYNIIKKIIDNGISKILYDKNIEFDEYISPDKMVDDIYEKEKNIFEAKKISDIAGISGANVNFNESYAETKGFMNGERGHGYAAEYGNNTFDRLMQKDVINAGQILDERGRQVKHGPDRIVDGEAIQTKYYKTANETIGVLFPKGQAIYLNSDGTMMPVEVPRDQYDQAVELMQKRIDSGQVPNAEPGTPAQNFVKKGWFTYNQACNICKAGTIESLSVDVASGVISSSLPGTISGVIFFAICIWNGKSIKDAAKSSLIATLKTMGKSIFIYTLTMQLSRGQFANVFSQKFTKDGIMAGYEGIANPVAHLSNELAKKISQSTLAKTSIGEFLGLRMVTGRAIISGTIIGVVVFGPDLVRALRGRISKMQLLKNSAVGAGSLAGAAIGQVLLPIPVVGAIVVAGVSGFIVKKTLDKFIEDDAIAMFQILKEEFLDVTMSMNLSKKEFDEVTLKVICNDRIHIKLQEMYQSGDARNFACAMVTNSVCSIIKDRKKIESEIVENGYTELFKKEVLQLM